MLSGGRSSLYVWNDAALCALFEIAATRAQSKGDAEKAGYYRAGAHLALSSLLQWFNQDGTLAIAKNHSSLHSRHGLEPYAHASNYNLLTAALLALAYEHFDASVLERRAPSQTKNIYLDTRETLGKIAANLHGTAIEINVRKNDSNDPVGLTRIDWNLADQRIIVPAGLLDKPPYGAPRPSTGATRASIGVSVQWHAQGESWQNLSSAQSQNGDAHAPLSIEQVQANEHHIEVQTYYHHLQNDVGVFETYDIEENAVRVTSRVDSAESRGIRMVAPILVDDGEVKLSPVHDANGCIQIVAPPSSSAAHRRATWCTNAGSLRLLPDKFTYRSGWAQLLVTDEQSSTQAIWLELRGGELP